MIFRLFFLLLICLGSQAWAADWYVAPTSQGTNNGTLGNEFGFLDAIGDDGTPNVAISAGDTLHLRAGTYTFAKPDVYLQGTSGNEITVTAYHPPGELFAEYVKLDLWDGSTTGTGNIGLYFANADYLIWEKMEIFFSRDVARSSTGTGTEGGQTAAMDRGIIAWSTSTNVTLRQCVVHDIGTSGTAIQVSQIPTNAVVAGNIIYNNMWYSSTDVRSRAHGIYARGNLGINITDNLLFNNGNKNIQANSESAGVPHDNLNVFRNISINADIRKPSTSYGHEAWLGTNSTPGGSDNLDFSGNLTWHNRAHGGGGVIIDTAAGSGSITMNNNRVVDDLTFDAVWSSVTSSGNIMWEGSFLDDTPSGWTNTGSPTGSETFVYQLSWDTAWAHAAIYNWNSAASVALDISGHVPVGYSYKIWDCHDVIGTDWSNYGTVAAGTDYDGGTVAIPMAAKSPPDLIGEAQSPSPPTAPDREIKFGAYVIFAYEGSGGGAGGYELLTADNAASSISDFCYKLDASLLSTDWWNAVDTADFTKGRAYDHVSETELAVDWIGMINNMDGTGAGLIVINRDAATSANTIRLHPPLAANASYAATDTYGSDNTYPATREFYWPMDEGSGTAVADRTSNAADATTVNSGTWSTGVFGSCRAFDGTDDYVRRVDISTDTQDEVFTIACWFQVNTVTANRGIWSIMGTISDPSASPGFAVRSGPAVHLRNGTTFFGTSDYAITEDAWHHCVVTCNGGTSQTLYLDGVSKQTYNPDDSSDNDLYLGLNASTDVTGGYFHGMIDEFHFDLTVQWSADQVAYEYAQTSDNAAFWTLAWVPESSGTVGVWSPIIIP